MTIQIYLHFGVRSIFKLPRVIARGLSCPKFLAMPKLRFKDVCKRDMKACNINTETWEASADDRTTWKQLVSQGLDSGEKAVRVANDGARAKRAARQQACTTSQQSTVFVCQFCSRRCSSRIGLFSHSRCCSSSKSQDTIP